MQPVQSNPNLAGLPQGDAVVLSEKLHHVSVEGFEFCAARCITHFGEDSIPYHTGEKVCLDRCVEKIRRGLYMAVDVKKKFEEQLRAGEMPYQWMRDAASGKFATE